MIAIGCMVLTLRVGPGLAMVQHEPIVRGCFSLDPHSLEILEERRTEVPRHQHPGDEQADEKRAQGFIQPLRSRDYGPGGTILPNGRGWDLQANRGGGAGCER